MRHTVAGLAFTDIDLVERQLSRAVARARAAAPPELRTEAAEAELEEITHPGHDPWVCLGRAREELVALGATVDGPPAGSYERDEAHRLAIDEWRRVEILLTDGGGST